MQNTIKTYKFVPFVKSPRFLSRKLFDRKTFDPFSNSEDKKILAQLRTPGGARWWRQGWEKWSKARSTGRVISSAMSLIPLKETGFIGKVLVDAGCGNSGDADYFTDRGGTGLAYDLFPRTKESYEFPSHSFTSRKSFIHTRSSKFKIQDICERWPNEDMTVDIVVSNAVLDLLSREERDMFYKECRRVIKDSGALVVSFIKLKNGHGFSFREESEMIRQSGFSVQNSTNNSLLAIPLTS